MLAISIAVITSIIQLFGLGNYLRYERIAIINGAIWRVVTGQLVHWNWSHLIMNLAALALILVINNNIKLKINWSRITFICLISVGLGLFIFNPEVAWYVGLSGLIHGWFAAGIIILFQQGHNKTIWLLLILIIKLIYEKWQMPLTGSLISTDVIIISAAHWYGALSGLVIGLFESQLKKLTAINNIRA